MEKEGKSILHKNYEDITICPKLLSELVAKTWKRINKSLTIQS